MEWPDQNRPLIKIKYTLFSSQGILEYRQPILENIKSKCDYSFPEDAIGFEAGPQRER